MRRTARRARPVRLFLDLLERREVVSENLSFLASGIFLSELNSGPASEMVSQAWVDPASENDDEFPPSAVFSDRPALDQGAGRPAWSPAEDELEPDHVAIVGGDDPFEGLVPAAQANSGATSDLTPNAQESAQSAGGMFPDAGHSRGFDNSPSAPDSFPNQPVLPAGGGARNETPPAGAAANAGP